jgi:uncharacterized protein YcbX
MRLDSIWLHPVKSMIGAPVEAAELTERGLVGDREWALRDLTTGGIANTRQTPGIMQFAASGTADHVVITLPGGAVTTSSDSDVDQVLSAALGRPVRLEALRPASDTDFFRRPAPPADAPPADLMATLREIFARDEDEPLPDFSKFAPEVMEFETPPGSFVDCYPLLVMTTSALRSLEAAVPDSVIDIRRFRPNIVIDTGDEPGHPELAWTGRRLAIGDTVIEIINDCPRCAAITKEISPDIPTDRAILRHVVRDLGQAVGAYARVVTPGHLSVGSPVS